MAHALELHEPCLSERPKGLNTVDVIAPSGKLVTAMVNPKMLFISQVNQAIVSTSATEVNYALDVYLSSYDGLQSGLSAIGHDFGINSATSLQDSKDRCFPRCFPSSPPPDTPGAEVGFVNFNLPFEKGFLLTQLGNSLPDEAKLSVNCVPVKTGQSSNFRGIQIKGEVLDYLPEFSLRNS